MLYVKGHTVYAIQIDLMMLLPEMPLYNTEMRDSLLQDVRTKLRLVILRISSFEHELMTTRKRSKNAMLLRRQDKRSFVVFVH